MTADLFMVTALLATWTWLRIPRHTYAEYLTSYGWKLTKALRKRDKCQQCGERSGLQLHHESYSWHNKHPLMRWIVPNMSDPMKTLCDYHHGKAHGKK